MSKSTSKIMTIIRHEYTQKVKSKSFLISTFLIPIGFVAVMALYIFILVISQDDTDRKLAIIDRAGGIGSQIVNSDTTKFYLTDQSMESARTDVLDGKIDGFVEIPANVIESGEVTIYTTGGGGIGMVNALDDVLGDIIRRERILQSGASEEVVRLVDMGVNVNTIKITADGDKEDFTKAMSFVGYFFGFVIYGLMFIYGAMVMRGVIEEKANRIVEIIASSVKPFDIMFGKVVGIGAVGLTQVMIWIILGIGILFAAGAVMGQFMSPDAAQGVTEAMAESQKGMSGGGMSDLPFKMPEIPPLLIVGFVFYFLAGYFIYSTLFAAVGSAVDQESDAQQLQLPVTLPIIIPILFIFNVMSNPDGTLAVVLSLIPLFTPILMIVRIAATTVPVWQLALSVVLLAATFWGVLWIAAKIYRVGILMYGKKPTFKDLWKWMLMSS